MLGIADPAWPSERRFDEEGRLAAIEQNGWIIQLDRFESVGVQYLPGKLRAENPHASIKLVVDDWSLPGGDAGWPR